MKKDSQFWGIVVFAFFVHFIMVLSKPLIHKMPPFAMDAVVKLELYFQIAAGMTALWYSIDRKLFKLFAKVYALLFLGYLAFKIPVFSKYLQYYIVVPNMFTPFPFVVCWLLDKAFSNMEENKSK